MIKILKYVFMVMVLFTCKVNAGGLNPREEELMRAAAAGDAPIVGRLLRSGVRANTQEGESTGLIVALRAKPSTDGHLEVIRLFLNAGASRIPSLPMGGPLHEAVMADNVPAARMLMREFGFDPREPMGHSDVTSITIAKSRSEAMKRLLDPWFGRRVAIIVGVMFD